MRFSCCSGSGRSPPPPLPPGSFRDRKTVARVNVFVDGTRCWWKEGSQPREKRMLRGFAAHRSMCYGCFFESLDFLGRGSGILSIRRTAVSSQEAECRALLNPLPSPLPPGRVGQSLNSGSMVGCVFGCREEPASAAMLQLFLARWCIPKLRLFLSHISSWDCPPLVARGFHSIFRALATLLLTGRGVYLSSKTRDDFRAPLR